MKVKQKAHHIVKAYKPLFHQIPPHAHGCYGRPERPVYKIFIPLVASINHILAVNEKSHWFKRLFKSDPHGNKNEKLYYDFHDNNGHKTIDCRYVRGLIEGLIR